MKCTILGVFGVQRVDCAWMECLMLEIAMIKSTASKTIIGVFF